MILRSDLDVFEVEVTDRMVPAVMTERKLEGRPPEGARNQLVPEANAEHRNPPRGDGSDHIGRTRDGCRISWTVRNKEPIRFEGPDVVERRVGGDDRDPRPDLGVGCHELRIADRDAIWRIVYRVDLDAIVLAVIEPRAGQASGERGRQAFAGYDLAIASPLQAFAE